jgi:hypothetical protein
MIDCEAIWNFFSQSKLTKIDVLILNEKFSKSKLKNLDDTSLMIYFNHALSVEIIDINESERTSKETLWRGEGDSFRKFLESQSLMWLCG